MKRIPGGRRGAVYASPDEIRLWLDSATPQTTEAEPQAAPPQAPGSPWRRPLFIGLAAAASLAALLVAGRSARPPQVATAEMRGSTLTALDKQGHSIWSYEFNETPEAPEPTFGWPGSIRRVEWTPGAPPQIVAAIRHPRPEGPRSEVICFDPHGSIRWRWAAHLPFLDFNGQPFEQYWTLSHVLPDQSNPDAILWVAVSNPLRWASGLFRIDSAGSARLQFANAGSIQRVLRLPGPDGGKLLVAGVNNAWAQPFLAEIDPLGPPAFSPPSGKDRYHFANGPRALPKSYLLLPHSEIHRAGNVAYFHVSNLTQIKDRILVELGALVADGKSVYTYEFDLNLKPLRVRPTASGVGIHQNFEAKRELLHPVSQCPEMTNPHTIRRWFPNAGWTGSSIPVAGPNTTN